MAFDGSVVSGIANELQTILCGGSIAKISQPEKDALILLIKNNGMQFRLFLSASASLPFISITEKNKKSPLTAPNFCMLLRKHLGNAKILEISQPSLERIIRIKTEHLDEMGDLSTRYLVIELMGKYSNILLLDEKEKILDGIKHITAFVSSVREVLPNKEYFVPEQEGKINPFTLTSSHFYEHIVTKATTICKALYQSLTGFSPVLANEVSFLAGLDSDSPINSLTSCEADTLYQKTEEIITKIKNKEFSPTMYLDEMGKPIDFSAFPLKIYSTYDAISFERFSELLETYYGTKETSDRIRQKSTDLRKILGNAIERSANKIDIFRKQLQDTEKMEKFRLYGELILANAYQIKEGDSFVLAMDYVSEKEIKIPLTKEYTAMENSQKYFEKYKKLKRTAEAVTVQLSDTEAELLHLESIKTSLEIAENVEDLVEIREELIHAGYLKRKNPGGKKGKKEKETKSKPLHFISSDGFDIYVGKNNFQNDFITFKLAGGGDWWFHIKQRPGSHVVLLTNGREVPDRAFVEAAKLAVHYSGANTSSNVNSDTKYEVDYVLRKEVKKPNGAKPGFVVYYTNYSLMADSDISMLKMI